MRKPSPISTSSPRLTTISRSRARASPQSSNAAALLLTTCTARASGTAAASAASAPRPRRARWPVDRSYSTSVVPVAIDNASRAAADSGARPRLVWMMTPVALITHCRLVAWAGSVAIALSAISSGSISPRRARSCASVMASFTVCRPRRPAAAASSGTASRTSVAGMRRRRSTPSSGDNAWMDIAATPDEGQMTQVRLTQYAHGGGCACKIPPGELEAVLAGLQVDGAVPDAYGPLLVGLDSGDDAAVVAAPDGGPALVLTTDFFTPVVDDAYDWGRIAATNALSDIYAMGGRPVLAVNLLCWPRGVLPMELATDVLRGGLAVTSA